MSGADRKPLICPSCFAREIDVCELRYDERDDEYYCVKCAYSAKREDVQRFLDELCRERYRSQT